jgi:hypothetical protein
MIGSAAQLKEDMLNQSESSATLLDSTTTMPSSLDSDLVGIFEFVAFV